MRPKHQSTWGVPGTECGPGSAIRTPWLSTPRLLSDHAVSPFRTLRSLHLPHRPVLPSPALHITWEVGASRLSVPPACCPSADTSQARRLFEIQLRHHQGPGSGLPALCPSHHSPKPRARPDASFLHAGPLSRLSVPAGLQLLKDKDNSSSSWSQLPKPGAGRACCTSRSPGQRGAAGSGHDLPSPKCGPGLPISCPWKARA